MSRSLGSLEYLVSRTPGSLEYLVSGTPGSRFLGVHCFFLKLQTIATAFKATINQKTDRLTWATLEGELISTVFPSFEEE